MKTSIKLLLGLLLIIFLIPTCFFMAFSYRAKNHQFKRAQEIYGMDPRVDIGPARFIKLYAPKGALLHCNILPEAEKSYYFKHYNNPNGTDSLIIEKKADTLFVTVVEIKTEEQRNYRGYQNLDLHLTDWENLQLNNVNVDISNPFINQQHESKFITAYNSTLNFGTPTKNEYEVNVNKADTVNTSPYFFKSLKLAGDSNDISINKSFRIEKIDLDITAGKLHISSGAIIDAIEGFISKNTELNIAAMYIRKLSSLAVK